MLKYKFDSRGERTKKVNSLAKTTVNCLEKITEKIGQHAITKEKTLECIQIQCIFTINIIRGNLKPLSNQASVLEITKLIDERTSHESQNMSLFSSLWAHPRCKNL